MAGLLDLLSAPDAGNGIGGLLSYLQSPLYQSPPAAPAPQPQYDAMGNYTGITPDAPNPFGPIPQMNMPTPAQFQPSVFNGGVSAPPVAGIPSLAPQGPAPQAIAPAQPQQAAAPQDPTRTMNVGNYQMPQIGAAADYAPQAPTSTDISAQSRQPTPQQGQLPYALGGRPDGFFDRLNTGLQSIGNGGSIIGALTGNRTDSQSIAQQNLKAKYDNYLANGLTHSQAMLAAINPKASEIADQRILEKKQYGFQKMDSDTIVRTDPLTGKAELAYGGGEDSNSITGPDGKQIAIPPGVDRKTFVNEVSRANAKAAAGEKTEVQAKAEIFANKMEMSNKSISDDIGGSLAGKIASGIPLGNYIQSPEYQKYKQASSNFITALLRQESGAAISKSEFERYDKEYMPQPGDSKEVLAQKTQARQVAIEGMKKGAGPGYKSPTELGPSVGAVQMGYRFKGGNPADRGSWEKVQ